MNHTDAIARFDQLQKLQVPLIMGDPVEATEDIRQFVETLVVEINAAREEGYVIDVIEQ